MMYNFIYMLAWIISVLISLILFESVSKWIYSINDENCNSKTNILIIKNNQGDIEYMIRRSLLIHSLNSENCNLVVVCPNLDVDSETKKICSLISKNFDYIKFTNI